MTVQSLPTAQAVSKPKRLRGLWWLSHGMQVCGVENYPLVYVCVYIFIYKYE